jgi:hypothetical protein
MVHDHNPWLSLSRLVDECLVLPSLRRLAQHAFCGWLHLMYASNPDSWSCLAGLTTTTRYPNSTTRVNMHLHTPLMSRVKLDVSQTLVLKQSTIIDLQICSCKTKDQHSNSDMLGTVRLRGEA